MSEVTAPAVNNASGWLTRTFHYAGKALRSPEVLTQVLRARWQLRRCDTVAGTIRLRGRVFVENHGRIELGDRVRIEARTVPVELACWRGAALTVGDGTYLNYGVSLSAHRSVQIGRNCLVGNYVVIMDSDYHDLHDRTLPGDAASIVIEDDVWLGTRATVLKGVRIGKGSVVGAGAVVTDDVPPRSVVFGVPARVVREL
jgi:maltose O-acetyltransferase